MSSQGTKNQRQEQAAATRQKLLTSAQHLFAQNGYKGTTVRMINRSVDLADGLLYHYFPGGKKEIFKEVITGNMPGICQRLYIFFIFFIFCLSLFAVFVTLYW